MNLTRDINPDQEYLNEFIPLPNGMFVHRYGILQTSIVRYEVYEPSTMMGAHTTITLIDEKWYGSVTSRPLPAELEQLQPGSRERIVAVRCHLDDLEELAETIVRLTFSNDFLEYASV